MQTVITDFGAESANPAPQTSQIQQAIDAVGPTGGRVIIPPGVFFTGTVWLRSGVELHLAKGAVLKGTNQIEDYPAWDAVEAGVACSRRVGPRRMIGASQCEHVAITGLGQIDGDGGCGGQAKTGGAEAHPQNLQFIHCQDVAVKDVSLRNAGSWMQQYHGCEQVRITGINIWNHGNRTNDGLDIDGCTDVRISDCDIDSHDDALVFKSTGPRPCRNIIVTQCRLRSNCHGLKFGTESVGGFENIMVSQCIITPSRQPDPMEGYPDGRPVITGCALECVDGGTMRNIHIDGLIADGVFAPIFIKLGNRLDRRLKEEDIPQGIIEDVSIRNLRAYAVGPYTSSISGYPGRPVRRVTLEDIELNLEGGGREKDVISPVPENSDQYPEMNMFTKKTQKKLPAYALYARHVEGLKLMNFNARTRKPDARKAIVTEDVDAMKIHE